MREGERDRESSGVCKQETHRTTQGKTKQAEHGWICKDRVYGTPMAILWFGAWMLESPVGNEFTCFRKRTDFANVLVCISVNSMHPLGFNYHLFAFLHIFVVSIFPERNPAFYMAFWILPFESLQVTGPQHF